MAHDDRFKLIPSVYLLLEKGGKTLLMRRCNTGFEDGKYGLFAGHAEEEEKLTEALKREIKEEAGILLNTGSVALVHIMHRNCGDHERIDFFFTATDWQGEITNMEPDKCDHFDWFPLDNLPKNTIDYIASAIKNWQDGILYSEFNW